VPQFAAAFSGVDSTVVLRAASRDTNGPSASLRVTNPGALTDVYGDQMAPGYAVYDTWSFHYENDGRK